MAEALGRPPFLNNEAIVRLISKYFNFKDVEKDSIKHLPSFEDRNVYFRGKTMNSNTCSEFVLKLSNPLCTPTEVIKGLNAAMNHIKSCGFSFSTCYPLPCKDGTDVMHLTTKELAVEDTVTPAKLDHVSNGSSSKQTEQLQYHVRVLHFVSGQVLDSVEKQHLTPNLLEEVGKMIGSVNKELKENFRNEALESTKNPHWDLMDFLNLKPFLKNIDEPKKKKLAEAVFLNFEAKVIPQIPSFEKGIVHCDTNGQNIIVNKTPSCDTYHVAGLIDFGHSLRTCVVFDLGICLAYLMLENIHPVTSSSAVKLVGPVIRGYNSVIPLTKEEFDSLYYLALARCLQSALNGERAFRNEPWNSYLLTSPKKAWQIIDILLEMTEEEVNSIWKKFYC